ncbi:MAG: hypothetical protein IK115_02830 [Lachnospiraceae bacterium]|nr:hypothetical protein [Lachnospiraceae bacterium]
MKRKGSLTAVLALLLAFTTIFNHAVPVRAGDAESEESVSVYETENEEAVIDAASDEDAPGTELAAYDEENEGADEENPDVSEESVIDPEEDPDVDSPEEAAVGAGSTDPSSPTPIGVNQTITDHLSSGENTRYYSFSLTAAGCVYMTFGHEYAETTNKWEVKLYRDRGYNNSDDTIAEYSYRGVDLEEVTEGKVGLPAGTYGMSITASTIKLNDVDYRFSFSYTATDDWEEEPDSAIRAKSISSGKYYYGVTTLYDTDYYYFDVEEAGKVSIYFSHDVTEGSSKLWELKIYNEHGYHAENEVAVFKYTGTERKEVCDKVSLEPGRYYIGIRGLTYTKLKKVVYKFKFQIAGDTGSTGKAVMDGTTAVSSLKKAFAMMKDKDHDYVISLQTDMLGEKNLKIPKSARSVTILGNGHMILIKGGSITANTRLILENVRIRTENKKGALTKLTINAKCGLGVNIVNFETKSTNVKVKGAFDVNSTFAAETITAQDLNLNPMGSIWLGANHKLTVKNLLNGAGGNIRLMEGFNKPVSLGGTVTGSVNLVGESQPDGKQILSAKTKKLSPELLKGSFRVEGITSNTIPSSLYYYSGGKAAVFGEAIGYNGQLYGLWKDAVAQMNLDRKAGMTQFIVDLYGDVRIMGAFKMPSKGYESIRIGGNGHTVTFTGNIKLTGDTLIENAVLRKVDKKGNPAAGKIIRGKYTYVGPEIN